jgi:hypothetical protein
MTKLLARQQINFCERRLSNFLLSPKNHVRGKVNSRRQTGQTGPRQRQKPRLVRRSVPWHNSPNITRHDPP